MKSVPKSLLLDKWSCLTSVIMIMMITSYFTFSFFLVDYTNFFLNLMIIRKKTLVCLRLLRKALFLVRTLKPIVLALLNQANSPAAGCMRPGFRLEKCASLIHAYRAATPPPQRRHAPLSVRSTVNRGAISPYQRCLILRGSEKCTCFGYIGLLWAVRLT